MAIYVIDMRKIIKQILIWINTVSHFILGSIQTLKDSKSQQTSAFLISVNSDIEIAMCQLASLMLINNILFMSAGLLLLLLTDG